MSSSESVIDYPSDREMVFTRRFAAPIQRVWDAWTDREQAALWWGPKGFTTTTEAMEVRPGGQWRFVMHGPDGVDYPNLITYREVQSPKRLVFDHGDDQNPSWFVVTVDFTPEGDATTMVMRMQFNRAEDLENTKKYGIDGHRSTMSRLDSQLVALAESDREIVISRVLKAPRELVWQALSQPGHVAQWWGPKGFHTETEQHDFRVGGVWKHVMVGPDGARYPNKSIFKEIVPLERVVYSHGGGREEGGGGATFVATWTLESSGKNHTRLTLHMRFADKEGRDRVVREYNAVEGGRQTLQRLSEHLVGMGSA